MSFSQGLFKRGDWAKASKIPLTILAGGSGNGLARTLVFENGEEYGKSQGVLETTLNLITGNVRAMDVMAVQTRSGHNAISFLSVGWGFFADCDIESEAIRFLGEPRFALWAFLRVASLRHYRAKLSYKRAKPRVSQKSFRSSSAPTGEDSAASGSWRELNDYPSADSARVNLPVDSGDFDLPPFDQPLTGDEWTVREDEFVMVYAINTAYIGATLFIAPKAKLDDGVIWLLVIRKGVSKMELFDILFSIENGEHVGKPGVELVPVSAFRLEPDLSQKGHITLDGELLPYEPIQVQILPSHINLMTK